MGDDAALDEYNTTTQAWIRMFEICDAGECSFQPTHGQLVAADH